MRRLALLFVLLLAGCGIAQPALQLPSARPKQVGMDAARLARVDGVIEASIASGDVPGAVLAVVRHDRLVYLKAYGHRSVVPDSVAMDVQTVFDLASLSKCVGTTIGVLQLMENGQLRLQDRVDYFFPDFTNWKDPQTGEEQIITIQDLMTHTSGLPAYGPTEDLVAAYGSPSPDGLMHYISTCARLFAPQTQCLYSCLNFITLQNILEKITGQRLCDYAQENIFNVLQLKHTSYRPLQGMPSGMTREQWEKQEDLCAPTEVRPNGGVFIGQVHDPLARLLNGGNSGNAGVFSNAEDLAVMALALLNGGQWQGNRILSPLTVQAMARVPEQVAPFKRTLGWDNGGSCNGNFFDPLTVFGHTGYTGTSMLLDFSADVAVILLTNRVHPHDDGSVVRLRTLVANVVAGAIIE